MIFQKKKKDEILAFLNKIEVKSALIGDFNGDLQCFYMRFLGSNGKENSIKNSLIQCAKELEDLEKEKNIKYPQILNIDIDNLDDLYYPLFTFLIK